MSDSQNDQKNNNSHSGLTKPESQFLVHPLLRYDPDAAKWIKVIKASYFESSETKPPVPRNQDLPKEAFGELTGRCILAATSHAWFYQSHPDPEGVKLNILRDFIKRLRKRYPETEIVIFDDWHSCPQWPRTEEQDEVFYKAMDHMNSMYVYCDVVLFLEAKLPDLDMTVRCCTLIPSNYSFGIFVDVTQFHGPESSSIPIKKNDIIIKPANIDTLKTTSNEIEISYFKRPFGRPNRIPADERGWLYAERITIAVKVATAGQHRFDEIVWSNNEDLRTTIYTWARILLAAANRDEIGKALEEYKTELAKKRFTRPDDTKVVGELVESLVDKFATRWKEETKRQESMSMRAREILLRWGEFSNEYVKNARLLKQEDEEDGWMRRSFGKFVGLSVFGALFPTVPFVLNVTDECVDSAIGHSIWFGGNNEIHLYISLFADTHLLTETTHAVVYSWLPVLVTPIVYNAYISVPLGFHTLCFYFYLVLQFTLITLVFHVASGDRIPPCFVILLTLTSDICSTYTYKIQCFKHYDDRDGRVEMYGIDPLMKFPTSMRHNSKIREKAEHVQGTSSVTFLFGMLYPILGGVFFQANIVIQACLIPVFFALRSWYEYKCDALITNTYGSDKFPILSFGGVMLHEICLSTMITSIKHPLVFTTLILADMFENAFCLWSLHRSKSSSSTIVPVEIDVSSTNYNNTRHKSLTKRSSSVFSLAKDLRESKDESSEGTALFIAAILLQREMVETIVPMQACAVMTLLYASDVKSNSMVSQWSSRDDYVHAMMYLGIDLGAELIVFACSILALKKIYPKFSAWRILMGLVRSNSILMLSYTVLCWSLVLVFQNTLSGLDLTLKFEWLNCNGENATWISGFDWDNC